MKFKKQASMLAVSIFVFVTLFSSLFSAPVPASAADAVVNVITGDPTFESNVVGDLATSTLFDFLQINDAEPKTTRASIVADGANGTKNALKLDTTDANWQSVMKHARDTELKPNQMYKFSAYVKGKLCGVYINYPGPVAGKDAAGADAMLPNGRLSLAPELFPDGFGPATWTLVEGFFTTGANTKIKKDDGTDQDFGYICIVQGSFGSGYVDEIVLQEWSEPIPAVKLPKLSADYGATTATTKLGAEYGNSTDGADGATVTISNGTTVLGTTVAKDFAYSVRFKAQAPGTKLSLVASKAGNFTNSDPLIVTVKLQKPSSISATSKSVYVLGKAYAGSTASVYVGKKKVGSVKVGSKGTFKVKMKAKLKKGTKITVYSTYKSYKTYYTYKLSK